MPITTAIIAGESTLSLTRTDLRAFIGEKMSGGEDYDPAQWDAHQTYQAASVLASAERMFYGAYDWSFLKPWFNLTFEVGVESYDFPSDYGGMVGPIIYVEEWARCGTIIQSDMATVEYDLGRMGSGDRGYPTRYATEILPMSGESQGQRHAIRFNRRPSQACKLRGQYYVHPYDLSEARPYPLGGMAHAECLKWACAAMIEVEIDGISNGTAMAHYERLLAASMRIEMRNAPTHLGVMGSKRLVRPHDDPPLFTGDVVYRP
jgi:hypothetical protein